MQGSKARSWTLLPLLALLLVSASVPAQVPDADPSQGYYNANVLPQQGSVSIEYLGSATVPILIEDISTQPGGQDGPPRESSQIFLSVDVVGNNTDGWTASLSKLQIQTRPGDTHQLRLNIQAGATISEPTVEVRIQSVYDPIAGDDKVTNASVMAVAESFPRLRMQMAELPDDFEPDELQSIPITVSNENYYPDMVSFEVTGPDAWMISPPSSVRLAPGETKTVYVDAKAPENPWFRYTTKSELVSVEAISETSGVTLVSVGVPVTQSGSNAPAWIVPHLFLLLAGAALLVVRSRRKLRERRLEKGKPSYPGLDPEHEAELEALKIEDPEEAETVEGRLETLYEKRKREWKEAYEKRQEAEESLAEAYGERHDALVAARDQRGGTDDPETLRERRELLSTKRELLERKREALQGSDRPEGSQGTSS